MYTEKTWNETMCFLRICWNKFYHLEYADRLLQKSIKIFEADFFQVLNEDIY
jgi:hypothetical protein